jgi:predicted nucleic acid-binding protein
VPCRLVRVSHQRPFAIERVARHSRQSGPNRAAFTGESASCLLVVAATAERAGLAVVHLDKDFDLIAEVTGQPTERLAGA